MPSQIAAAIDSLVTIAQGLQSTTLAGVDVYDGPKLDASMNGRRLFIGYDAQGLAGEGAQSWVSMPAAGRAREERVTIHCVAESSSGETVMKALRDDAVGIMQALEAAVKGDPTLGGAVTYANFAVTVQVHEPQMSSGAVCTIFFGIEYYARFN